MNTKRLFLACSFIALLGGSIQGRAEDIDLYSTAALLSTDLPNVLFIVDNAANFNADAPDCTYASTAGGGSPSLGGVINNTSGGIEQCALVNAINALPLKADGSAVVNVGIMVYNISGTFGGYTCNGGTGGCLVKPLTGMTAANKTSIINSIKAWTTGTIQASHEATAQAMQEAWAYYAGKTGMSGRTYTSPALGGCQKNYIIFIGNAINNSGSPGDAGSTPGTQLSTTIDNNTALTTDQKNMLKGTIQIAAGAYGTSSFTCAPNPYTMGTSHTEISGLYADEWARYMHDVDIKLGSMPSNRKVVTYTIGVLSDQCKSQYPALLTSMATRGGGKYFATANADDILQAILRVLNEVQAVNSVFSSSSLPVSVNTQGTYLNQIFMGMFRPDSQGTPRWLGNLKQYQFSYDATTQNLFLSDAVGIDAISGAGTGFLSPNAASFWTCSNSARNPAIIAPYDTLAYCNTDPAKGFWQNGSNGIGLAYDLPDGEVVEKGGAAQMLRLANFYDDYTATPGTSSNPRNLYTCINCTTTTALSGHAFDPSNSAITDVMLGTGPRDIAAIIHGTTVLSSGTVPGAAGAAASVTITALSKSGSTVTAKVSAADLLKLTAGATELSISTGAPKYNCPVCVVTGVNTATNTFTYVVTGGGAGAPTLPSVATIHANKVTMTSTNHGLMVGQLVTISGCTIHTALNNTVATVSAATANDFTLSIAVQLATTGTDTTCSYTPNTATVQTVGSHGFATGSLVTIAGATGSTTEPYTGYNGIWVIIVLDDTHFVYQYTAAGPLANFAGAGATATSSGTTRDSLIRWVRGEDNYGDEASLCPPGIAAGEGNCPAPRITIRPSVHGDVLHSRPVVLNYGGTNGVIVFYGGNDGVFRSVNGNQTNPASSTLPSPGRELWGFIPQDFIPKLKRQHDNSPVLQMPSTLPGIIPTPQKKDYFVDGSTGVYQVIDGNGITIKAYLYLALRRGGRFMYMLNVSTPTDPVFMKKISNTDADFSELGQTWSQPKVALVNGYNKVDGTPKPVLIFGGGYDAAAEDAEPPTADSMGRGIYIVDAETGVLVWKATYGAASPPTATARTVPEMTYSIPSDITLVDRNSDGRIDRMYVGDMGGNLWRVDLGDSTSPNNVNSAGGFCSSSTPADCTSDLWHVEKLAALGCPSGPCPSGTTPRKIFYPPEVLSTASYDAVFLATGDREHPLWSTTANRACTTPNRAYLLKDMGTGLNSDTAHTTLTEAGGNLFDATTTQWTDSITSRGYYVTFQACEKSVNAPLVVAGFVYFGTNRAKAPENETCEETLGEATGYRLAPFTGKYSSGEFEGGGLPPSPVSGIVNIVVDGKTIQVPFCIGCGGEEDDHGTDPCGSDSALAGCRPPIDVTSDRSRTYWYIQGK
jgi:Tfp pilus tip-associated adhesin PilY1